MMKSLPASLSLALFLAALPPGTVAAGQETGGAKPLMAMDEEARARSERLGGLLPPALDGWTRTVDPASLATAAMFGIVSASATYWATSPDDPRDELTRLMERVPLVSITLWADPKPDMRDRLEMQWRAAEESGLGWVEEIEGEQFVVTPLGDLQALVADYVVLTIAGSASAEQKRAYLEATDIAALGGFRP